MICQKCNLQIPDFADFCPCCGERVESSKVLQETVHNSEFKKTPYIIGGLIAILGLIIGISALSRSESKGQQEFMANQEAKRFIQEKYSAYNTEVAVARKSESAFNVECPLNVSGEVYDLEGNISFQICQESDGDWKINAVQENVTYTFNIVGNYYYDRERNNEYLFEFTQIGPTGATVTIYSYYMGGYMKEDKFDRETRSIPISYDQEEGCFTLSMYGDWRICPNSIERDEGEKLCAYPQVEFEEKEPVKPEDYWWFNRI